MYRQNITLERSTRGNKKPLFDLSNADAPIANRRSLLELMPGGAGGKRTLVTDTDRSQWNLASQQNINPSPSAITDVAPLFLIGGPGTAF